MYCNSLPATYILFFDSFGFTHRFVRCKQTMRSRIPDMNDKQLEKMAFLERCLHCLHVVGERIEVRDGCKLASVLNGTQSLSKR